MTELGGLWIKQGQYLASRADFVPKPLGRHLAAMLDANPPRPLSEVVTTLREELGERGLEQIASICPTPLSTASIAQVHAATLRDGRKVAVQVQRPNCAPTLRGDIANLTSFPTKLASALPVDYYTLFCALELSLPG